jgi:hypothetical protein
MKWMGFILITMLLVTTGIVVAEDNSTTDNTTIVLYDNTTIVLGDNTTDYIGRSIDLRYENLVCKIDFTVGQIDVIKEYTNDTNADIIDKLLSDKDTLLNDKDDLKTVYDDKNLTDFNDFVSETLHPDFNETSTDLREFKDDYKIYISEADRDDFRNALIELKNTYTDCTNIKNNEMSRLMDQYYTHREGMWDQIIKSMNQRGLNTTEMEQVREQLQTRLQQFEDAINSGNQTQLREQLQQMKDEHTQLWTKFHSGRLNSYLNRIEPAANKFGRSAEVEKIKGQLKELKNISENFGENNGAREEVKNTKEEAKRMWESLKDSADEMRNMSKDMLKQRAQDNKQEAGENGQGSSDNNANGMGRR